MPLKQTLCEKQNPHRSRNLGAWCYSRYEQEVRNRSRILAHTKMTNKLHARTEGTFFGTDLLHFVF